MAMAMKKLSVPFYSQLDNDSDYNSGWWNECSYSAMAAYLGFLGYVGNGNVQFDDQLEREYEKAGLRRGAPYDMRAFLRDRCQARGFQTVYNYELTRKRLREILDSGSPVILHTWLTRSGHVATLVGYDDNSYRGSGAWLVHDPNGEWSGSGYTSGKTGEYVEYSYDGAGQTFGRDGDIWGHYLVPDDEMIA